MIQEMVINLMEAYGKRRDDGDKFLIGIPQTLFKFHPDYDLALDKIIKLINPYRTGQKA